jgi:hypothetical protein
MVLRLVVYWALGLDALLRHQFVLAILCFVVPFAGPIGMHIATLAGIFFLFRMFYIEGAIAIGLIIFNLVGNHWMQKRDAKDLAEATKSSD